MNDENVFSFAAGTNTCDDRFLPPVTSIGHRALNPVCLGIAPNRAAAANGVALISGAEYIGRLGASLEPRYEYPAIFVTTLGHLGVSAIFDTAHFQQTLRRARE
jgi:hypothetical protein